MKKEIVIAGKNIWVGLDRIVIGLPYPKLPEIDALGTIPQKEMVLAIEQRKTFVAKMKHIKNVICTGPNHCGKAKNKDSKRYFVHSEFNGELLCIFSLGFSYGTGVINLELNPSKLTPAKFGEIHGLLSVMFYDHYQELYEQGVVSHAEFCIDVSGEDLCKLVLIDEGRRATTIHKGTTYHGGRTSSLVGTMYDKAKQLKVDGKLVRIEVRINRRDISFRDLVEKDLFNPLSTFLAVEVSVLQTVAQEWNAPHLASNIVELGLHGAIANKQARKEILAILKEKAAPWWQPDLFWASHRELLLKFKPGHPGVFA